MQEEAREMKKRTILVISLVLAWHGASGREKIAHVAPAPPPHWSDEPSSFIGVSFNRPFDLAAVNTCPKNGLITDYSRAREDGKLCFASTFSAGYYEILNPPDLGFTYALSMKIENGIPAWFSISTSQMNFDQLARAFSSRYGKPTSQDIEKVKNISGAEFGSAVYKWTGSHVEISVIERSGKVDTAGAYIANLDTVLAKQKAADEATAKGAEKF
jgi:hypothetical protein